MSDDGPDLLDVLAGHDEQINRRITDRTQAREAEAARRAQYRHRRAVRPDTREPSPTGDWCGRCGENVAPFDLTINHDIGYCGCPVEHDPTWKRLPRRPDGKGFRGYGVEGRDLGTLTVEELCDRWDRQHFPDCACGHPWGLHENHANCLAWCGCQHFEEASC